MMAVTDVAIGPPVDKELQDSRWRRWQAKGRADDLRFRGRLRRVLIAVAAVVAVGGALWVAFLL